MIQKHRHKILIAAQNINSGKTQTRIQTKPRGSSRRARMRLSSIEITVDISFCMDSTLNYTHFRKMMHISDSETYSEANQDVLGGIVVKHTARCSFIKCRIFTLIHANGQTVLWSDQRADSFVEALSRISIVSKSNLCHLQVHHSTVPFLDSMHTYNCAQQNYNCVTENMCLQDAN